MFRCSAIFPILLSVGAFILSLLVVLAGSNTDFMNDVYVLRVNASQISTTTSLDSILSSAGVSQSDISTADSAIDSAVDSLGTDVDSVINTVAHELGLHDFYYAHVSTWCEATVTNSSISSPDNHITNCSSPKYPFSFNPISILENELLRGIQLDDLGFPTEDIDRVVSALQTAYRAMTICYLLGVILTGLSILTGIAGFCASRVLEVCNQFIALLAFFALGIASAISTAIAIKVKDVFNDKAKVINISADNSTKFLAMTWAAVALAFLVTMTWCFVCCCGSHTRRKDRHPKTVEPIYADAGMAQTRPTSFMTRFKR